MAKDVMRACNQSTKLAQVPMQVNTQCTSLLAEHNVNVYIQPAYLKCYFHPQFNNPVFGVNNERYAVFMAPGLIMS
jgi:hypothetical protein